MYWRKVHREYILVCHLRKQTIKVTRHSGFCQTDEVLAASVIVDGICNFCQTDEVLAASVIVDGICNV